MTNIPAPDAAVRIGASTDYKRNLWPIDPQGFNALDPLSAEELSAEELGECYACIVGVWTGPKSHSEGCPLRNDAPPTWTA